MEEVLREPILAPRTSTSVWKESADAEDAYVATLTELGKPRILPLYNGEPNPSAKVLSIQLVKRSQKILATVAGMDVTPANASPETGNFEVPLTVHSGLYSETISKSRVLSPCAVSLMVEDGEKNPDTCLVQVFQRIKYEGETLQEAQMIGSVNIEPFSVKEATAPAVYAPYPLTYYQTPKVTIFDLTKVQAYYTKQALGVVEEELKRLAKTSEGFLITLRALRVGVGNVDQEADRRLLGDAVASVALASVAIGFIYLGFPYTPAVFQTFAGNLTYVGGFNWAAIQTTLLGIASKYFFRPSAPEPIRVSFTLRELGTTLLSICNISSLSKEQATQKVKEQSYRRERLVLNWLVAPEEQTLLDRFSLGTEENVPSGLSSRNNMNFEKFKVDMGVYVETSLRVVIQDAEVCGYENVHVYEFINGRSDQEKPLLGAVASGLLDDLVWFRGVIEKFVQNITTIITEKERMLSRNNFTGSFSTWFDYNFFTPIYQLIQGKVASTAKARASALTNVFLLKAVLSNVESKLYKYFVFDDSEGRNMESRLQTVIAEKYTGPSQIPQPANVLLRCLPHRVSTSTKLFPSATQLDLMYVDYESTDQASRDFGALSGAISELNSAHKSAASAISLLVDRWESGTSRLRFVHAHSVTRDYKPYMQRSDPDMFCLEFSMPYDVRQSLIVGGVTEDYEQRMALITSSSSVLRLSSKAVVPNTIEMQLAVSVFAELWAIELVVLSSMPLGSLRAVSAAQSASSRAASRLRNAAEFILSTTTNLYTGVLGSFDVASVATEPGRDAALALQRANMGPRMPAQALKFFRSVASAMRRVSGVLDSETPSKLQLPPLASLFAVYDGSSASVDRCNACMAYGVNEGRKQWALSAAAASYPSVFLEGATTADGGGGLAEFNGFPAESSIIIPTNLNSIMERRVASLRVDFGSFVGIAGTADDQLVSKMASLRMNDRRVLHVPFGFGNYPNLVPRSPAPVFAFGSVPVWTKRVVDSIDSLLSRQTPFPSKQKAIWKVVTEGLSCIEPSGDNDAESNRLQHTMAIQTSANPEETGGRVTKFFSSSDYTFLPVDKLRLENMPYEDIKARAYTFTKNQYTATLQRNVSSMMWNAERILQCITIALADGVDVITIETPDAFANVDELRNTRPINVEQTRSLTSRIEYSQTHYTLLRYLLELVNVEDVGQEEGDELLSDPWVRFFGSSLTTPLEFDSDSEQFEVVNTGGAIADCVLAGTPEALLNCVLSTPWASLDQEDKSLWAQNASRFRLKVIRAARQGALWKGKVGDDFIPTLTENFDSNNRYQSIIRILVDFEREMAEAQENVAPADSGATSPTSDSEIDIDGLHKSRFLCSCAIAHAMASSLFKERTPHLITSAAIENAQSSKLGAVESALRTSNVSSLRLSELCMIMGAVVS